MRLGTLLLIIIVVLLVLFLFSRRRGRLYLYPPWPRPGRPRRPAGAWPSAQGTGPQQAPVLRVPLVRRVS